MFFYEVLVLARCIDSVIAQAALLTTKMLLSERALTALTATAATSHARTNTLTATATTSHARTNTLYNSLRGCSR
jgi:hypothetical protein